MKEMRMKKIDFSHAKWIWTEENRVPDQKIIVRKKFELENLPKIAKAYIACETKFWLWINEIPVVYEGGVFRESLQGCGYAEKIDLAPYLKKGKNVMAALVWFYGNGGRNNTNSGEAGFIFQCDAINLYSGADFLVADHPAYVKTKEPHPSYLFGGENVGYDARLDFGNFKKYDFDENLCKCASEYDNRVWGECVESPLPLLYTAEEQFLEYQNTAIGAEATLPYAMTLSIGLELEAEGGERIDIRTDRYSVPGGPGDEHHLYRGHRIEYIASKGKNVCQCPMYLYGEKVLLTFPDTVKLRKLSYVESGYSTKQIGSFKTDDLLFNRLIEKSVRTLYVCMRNNFMDCPDRERGQWIGDVSVQASQVFFVYDENAKKLLKKAIFDFINLRKGDVLVGNVPGENFTELPGQSLIAISEFGLLGEYYHYSLDKEVLELALEPAVRYLKLWNCKENGLVEARAGNWRWFDHLYNVDEDVLENCSYLAAAKYALKMADIVGRHEFDTFLIHRIQKISEGIEKHFWKNDHYASGTFRDERANAFAILSGVCPKHRYPSIRKILLTVFQATPYMERFVLKALCEMGYIEDAYHRMMSRYYNLIVNENSTLWEDFYILGTRNHAWSGCPLEMAFRYFLGLKTEDGFQTYTIHPVTGLFKEIHCSFMAGGKQKILDLKEENGIMKEV